MFPVFDSITGLRHGFSTRQDGNLRIPSVRTDTKPARDRYLSSIGISPLRLVSGELVHGAHVHIAQEEDAGTIIPSCDGLVTNVSGLALSVTGADCFPVYTVDPVERVIGIAHAGWRGTLAGVLPELISHMKELGADAEDVVVGIGPGIRLCHFEINEDVFTMFQGYGEYIKEREEKVFVDLPGIIKRQLGEAGILPDHVHDSGFCTFGMPEKYFSRRRDQQGPLETMLAHIMWESVPSAG